MLNTAKRVQEIIAEQLGVDEETVVPNATFIEDLKAEPMDCIKLIMAFEEEFGFEIPDEDAEKIITVRDAIHYIVMNVGENT